MPDDRRSIGVRVRPNSHDFIRQLRQDLASKKYTFYVDVGAKTHTATTDVRAWAAGPLQKIHAAVPVRANTARATAEMADWRRRQAGLRVTVPVHADTSAARREIEALQAMARDITVRVKADTDRARSAVSRGGGGGGARRSSVDKEFAEGLAAGTKKALERLGEVETKVKEVRKEAEKPIKTKVELEIEDLERQLAAQQIIAKSRKLKVPVEYDPTDLKGMKLQLDKLRLQERANKLKLEVEVQGDSLVKAKRAMDAFSKQFGNFSLIRSLDFGPLNLGKPTGLVGTLSTLTLLAGAVPGAVLGVTALADAMTRLAGAAALLPGLIGAVGASMATLTVGTKGISDAFDAMFAMWDEGASQQGKAATRMVAAQNNYKNAVVDETRAQERVADARRQALGELRGLNNELRGGVLNEAQALLDLQKARDRYAQGDFENNTDRLQSLLDIQKAELAVSNTREDNISLQQKATDAQAKGVEGSDLVRDALDAQRRAADGVTQALEALNAGGAGATTAAQKFQDQLSQLSPNAQDFVMTIAGMKDQLYEFRNSIQDTIFQGAGPAFANMFDNLLPVIQPGMQSIAQGLNQNLLQVFDTLQSPDGKSIIERILGGTAEAQKALSGLIDPLIRGFGTLTAAGAEHMPQLVELMTRFADRFATFIEKADRSGALDEFLDKGITALSDMVDIGVNLIKIVNDLSTAFGGNILTDIKELTARWHEFLSSEEGQEKLKAFIQEAKDLWADWKPVLEELPELFEAVSQAARRILGFLLPVLGNFLSILNKIPGALETVATVIIGAKVLGSFVTLGRTIGTIVSALTSLPGLINKIPGVNVPGLPGATPGGGGKPGTPPKPSAAPKAPIAGPGGPLVVAALGFEVFNAIRGALDEKEKLNLYLEARGKAQTDEDRQAADDAYFSTRIPPSTRGGGGRLGRGGRDDRKTALVDLAEQGRLPGVEYRDGKLFDTATNRELPGLIGGGFTNWPVQRGNLAMLHGKEYVQPAPTVEHYGVDAMKAVHDKRAVISYDTGGPIIDSGDGGMMPMANPNYGRDRRPPWWGEWSSPYPDDTGRTHYNPMPWGPNIPGSIGGGLGPWNSPFWKPGQRRKRKSIRPYFRGGFVPSFQGGGPNDPEDPRYYGTEHLSSGQAAPQPSGQGSILSALQTGLQSGTRVLSSTLQQGVQQASGAVSGAPGDAAVSPFGVTGAVPGPAAPGMAPTPGTPGFTTGSPLGDSFLGSLGIPGMGGGQNTGPGWGESGPPVGLGGGEDGFDIRNFGIGPGPPGSGPSDWLRFTGETLGEFGSGFVTTFAQGLLDFAGLGGIMQNFAPAGQLAEHFTGSGKDSKAQGPGAALTNEQVMALLGVEGQIAENPAYPGIPNLPDVFDPSTGSAVGKGSSKTGSEAGLQWKTIQGMRYIESVAPWVKTIGGFRPDELKWHPSGLALDVMIPGAGGLNDPTPSAGKAQGDQLKAKLLAHKEQLGIDYILWQEQDHYNHLHVNFKPSGYPPGSPKGQSSPKTASPDQPGGNPPAGFTVPSFAPGGYNIPTGMVVPPIPPPRPPDVLHKQTPVTPTPKPPVAPKMTPPAITPPTPPSVPHAPGGPPGPPPPGPARAPIGAPDRPATGVGPGETGSHLHPAAQKGITSGFATAGALAQQAVSMGMMAATMGASGAAGGMGGMGGGGAGGISISGMFQQAGKIVTDIANVGASFLVGNITGGTTENPYGVTQRGNVPSGGTKVVNASQNHYGDIQTSNLDEYFKLVDRRNAQKAQSGLGRWGHV
jgi:hypothetical protein